MSRFLLAGVVGALLGLCGCGVVKSTTTAHYQMHGVVVNVDPAGRAANIKHDKIVGYMDAMTMEYPVRDEKELAQLHAGETIDATLFVQDDNFWIGEIREVK